MIRGKKVWCGRVRRIKVNIYADLNKKILSKKLFINFIVIFLILELLSIPFSAASFTSSDGLDGNSKSTDTDGSPPAVGNEPSDSGSDSMVSGDTPTDSSDDSTVEDDNPTDTSSDSIDADDNPTESNCDSYATDDKTSDSDDNSYVFDDKYSDSSGNNSFSDDKTTEPSGSSLINDDNFQYAPNERMVSNDEIVSKTENTLGDLTSGIETELNLESSEDIECVKLTPATNLEEVKVTIIKLKDKPEEIIDPPHMNVSIYKYLDMKLITNDTYVKEDEINSLEFKFKVEKTWITDNKIDKSTVKLIRYHDGVWQNLSTELNDENETYAYYTAVSPGFSTFAVVGSKVVEKSESYGSDDISIPWSIIFAFIMALTIMLVIILFKARYIYLKDDSK